MALGPENARARHNQQALIEKSSLGTDTARGLRESVSAEHGRRIAQEAARREAGTYCPACKLNTPPAPYCTNCGGDTMADRPAPAEPSEKETEPKRGPWVHKNGEICVYAPQCAAPYVIGKFNDSAHFVKHAGELRLPEGFTPLAPASLAAKELPVGAFDIDAAVEIASEAARAAFVEMQRWGFFGPTSTAESWPTWQDVPDGIWFTGNGLGPIVAHRKRGSLVDNRDRDGKTIVVPDFLDATYPSGPFVRVEVDLAPVSAAARCPICFGLNGLHNRIHERYPAGGGGTNKPCPNTPPDDEPESL